MGKRTSTILLILAVALGARVLYANFGSNQWGAGSGGTGNIEQTESLGDSGTLTPTTFAGEVRIKITCTGSTPTPIVLTEDGNEITGSTVIISNVAATPCSFDRNSGVVWLPVGTVELAIDESLVLLRTSTQWIGLSGWTNDFPVNTLTADGDVTSGGVMIGKVRRGADITGAVNHNTTDLHGKMYRFTAAGTVTLDAAADVADLSDEAGCAYYVVRDAGEEAKLDPQAGEKINLNGTALAVGVAIAATGVGEEITICTDTDTDGGTGTDGYRTSGATSGWASE